MRKVAIASVQSPFVTGGAEYLARGLLDAIALLSGCDADLLTTPFNFGPPKKVRQSISYWETQNFHVLILIKFPLPYYLFKISTYYLGENKVLWLHQHRSV